MSYKRKRIDQYFKPSEKNSIETQKKGAHSLDNNDIFARAIRRKFSTLHTAESSSTSSPHDAKDEKSQNDKVSRYISTISANVSFYIFYLSRTKLLPVSRMKMQK